MTEQNAKARQTDAEAVQHLVLAVSGMHCANCVGRVEHNLLRVPGVRRATINLAQERADIDFDPAQATAGQFFAAVQQAGYKAQPWRGIGGQLRSQRIAIIRLVVCLFCSVPLLLEMLAHSWSWHGLVVPPLTALGLASIVQFWGGWPFYRGAIAALRARTPNMDVMVAIGSSIAYVTSVWSMIFDPAAMLVFESSALMITLVLLGRWIEAGLRRKTMAAVHHLVALQPQKVRRLYKGAEEMVPLPEIASGDMVVVWTGERVPLDGEVSDGLATFDYSLLTGETAPRVLGKGEPVLAGALCLNGSIKFTVTNHAGLTMLDRLADMVAVAQASHAPMQRLADQAAGYFIGSVLVFAALTFIFWGTHGDVFIAQNAALAILLLACPCALGLAVPMVVAVSVGQAARHGILLRDAAALERAAQVTTVIFDKTGTLSVGEPELAETIAFGNQSSDQILAGAAALNQKVNHPIAAALRRIVEHRSAPLSLPGLRGETKIVFGRGVQGTLEDGREMICGNLQYMSDHKVPLEDAAATAAGLEERGRMLSWLAEIGTTRRLLGLMAFRDQTRPEAQSVVSSLLQHDYHLSIISGDNRSATLSVAKRLGIGHMIGEALPQDKMQEIQKRQKWGEVVAMVGDGMNDAPALALADLGIAMHGGVDAADAAASVRLMRDDLRLVPAVFDLARTARRVMVMNIGWAVAFNVIGLPLAASGQLPPYLAALSMSLSSMIVVVHALTLKWWRPQHD